MKIILLNIVTFVQIILSQSPILTQFELAKNTTDYLDLEPGIKSNIINCIALQGDRTTWFGTGRGVSVMHDSTSIFTIDTFKIKDDTSRFIYDSIAAIATKDKIVAFSSLTSDENGDPIGAGVYITSDGLTKYIEWIWYDQPTNTKADSLAAIGDGFFRTRTVGGKRGNIAYDMDISKDYLWIASWYGGLRRMDLTKMEEWERVPLPLDTTEVLITCDNNNYTSIYDKLILNDYYWNSTEPEYGGNNNHKGFSVLAYGDTVWVGTANGINRGIIGENGCVNWHHFSHPDDNLAGNWVLSIAKQEEGRIRKIWAITVNTISAERRSVSYTRDDGETWEIVDELIGERCHDISITGSTILIASDSGLWKSENGDDWQLLAPAVEATPISSDEILSNTVYSVAADNRDYFDKPIIWIGTPDGLARSYNSIGDNWQIHRAEYDNDKIYAYPNPFSPFSHNQLNDDGWVRFNTGDISVEKVKLNIYNFALELVYSEKFNWRQNPGAVKWNGRDTNNKLVANGVYFINLQFSESDGAAVKDHWLKLVVVK